MRARTGTSSSATPCRRRSPASSPRISGYRETVRRPIRMTETASLIVPIIISFGEPFEIALNREPRPDERSRQLHRGADRRPGPGPFARRGALPPDRPDAARRLPLLRPADARADRADGAPRRPRGPRPSPGSASASARSGAGAAASRIAEAAVLPRLAGAGRLCRRSPGPIGRIVETGGAVRIGAIAERLEWSRKHLAARFREEVGMGPKMIARIARFNRAQAMAGSGEGGRLGGYRRGLRLCRPGASRPRIPEFAGATPVRGRPAGDAGRAIGGGRVPPPAARDAPVTFLQSAGRNRWH